MAYADQPTFKNRPAAIAGVIAVHAALGFVLMTGLATDVVKIIQTGPLPTRDYPDEVPPPPPPPPPPQADEAMPKTPVSPPVYTPPAQFDLSPRPVDIDTTTTKQPPLDLVLPQPIPRPGPDLVLPKPTPSPGRDPVGAAPRNDPASWVTPDDYRTSWINREMIGTAGFRLKVGTDGRVQNCSITRSSGHAELDKATCELVTRRARFRAAKDGFGETVSGTYSNSVSWRLPE